MAKRKQKNRKRIFLYTALFVLFFGGLVDYFFFTPMRRTNESHYVFIDKDDNIDSVYNKIQPLVTAHSFLAFKLMAKLMSYEKHIRTGRYQIGKEGAVTTFRYFRNGKQAPIMLTIRSVRTIDDLAKEISEKLNFPRKMLEDSLHSDTFCQQYDFEPATMIAMFVPNTHEFYWDTTFEQFMERMVKEYKRFWTIERTEKAKVAGFSQAEVITLASIVDEETDNEDEMPMIAGMYINRLKKEMPLQADPTVKFALKKFEAKRIYHKWLSYDSLYNTYKYRGLPPGPIRIPSIAAIDAVLNYVRHNYLYMCAKEDFSGTHNFAETYEEHTKNAEKYAKALNQRGIK